MSQLSLDTVSVSLGSEQVLGGVSLQAMSGEMTVVCGPNGAGKSTLLRAVAGLLPLDAGQVSLNDVILSELPAHTIGENVAYLPQGQVIHWPLDVESIVKLGRRSYLQAFGQATEEDEAAVEAALGKTGMLEFRDRPITQLSGGESARALLARMLASDASVYLVDEPLAALDPYYQMVVLDLLRQAADEGKIVMMVVHDLSIARRYFDTAFLLKEGKVIKHGKAEDVLSPAPIREAYDIEVALTATGGLETVRRIRRGE